LERDIKQNIKEAVKDGIDDYFSNKGWRFNLFTIPQVVWLIQIHFFMLNSMLFYFNAMYGENEDIVDQFPEEVTIYNEMIHHYLEEWIPFIGFLSVCLLVSGLLISVLSILPFVSKYGIIQTYAGYGFNSFLWFFLIYITYRIYDWSVMLFPLSFWITFMMVGLWQKLIEFINRKF